MSIAIGRAIISDAEEILRLQRLAYRSEAEIYGDFAIEPLVQSLDEVREQFRTHTFLKAADGERIVGSVRGYFKEGTCQIGKLMVDPAYRNRGIGKRLMAEIESHFGQCARYELFTGDKSANNLRLYDKLGYRRYKTAAVHSNLQLIYMEKENPSAGRE